MGWVRSTMRIEPPPAIAMMLPTYESFRTVPHSGASTVEPSSAARHSTRNPCSQTWPSGLTTWANGFKKAARYRSSSFSSRSSMRLGRVGCHW